MKFVDSLLLLFILVLPLGQFTRLPINLGFSGGVYLYDFLLPLMISLWLVNKLAGQKSLRLPPLSGRVAVFSGLAFLSLVNGARYLDNLHQFVVSGLYFWRWLMYAGLYFLGWDLFGRSESLRKQARLILSGGVLGFALVGLAQFAFFPDFSRFVSHGWDPHYYRVLSTFFDPNFAGLYLTLGFILIFEKGLGRSESKGLLWLVVLGLLLLAILLTFSRSTYLAFGVTVVFFGAVKSPRLLLTMILVGALAFVFIPRVQTRVIGAIHLDKTARLRLQSYVRTLNVIRDHPFLGVGFNTFRYVQEDYGYFRDQRGVNRPGGHSGAGADNSLLFLWATSGILGLLSYLYLLWGQFNLGHQKEFLLAASIVAVIVHAQFVNSLLYPWIMAWIWLLTALALAEPRLKFNLTQA